MKTFSSFLMVAFLILPALSAAEVTAKPKAPATSANVMDFSNDSFHFAPKLSVGVGTYLWPDRAYGVVKVSVLDFGPGDEGVQFFNFGLGIAETGTEFLFSPLTLFDGHFALAFEVGNTIQGFSVSYQF